MLELEIDISDSALVDTHIQRCEQFAADAHALYQLSHERIHLRTAEHWWELRQQAISTRGPVYAAQWYANVAV